MRFIHPRVEVIANGNNIKNAVNPTNAKRFSKIASFNKTGSNP
jgi:hypothetical protein